jgi:hypothetical protein
MIGRAERFAAQDVLVIGTMNLGFFRERESETTVRKRFPRSESTIFLGRP